MLLVKILECRGQYVSCPKKIACKKNPSPSESNRILILGWVAESFFVCFICTFVLSVCSFYCLALVFVSLFVLVILVTWEKATDKCLRRQTGYVVLFSSLSRNANKHLYISNLLRVSGD